MYTCKVDKACEWLMQLGWKLWKKVWKLKNQKVEKWVSVQMTYRVFKRHLECSNMH